ncbi:translation initiation factor IF-1 [Actibacterium sp.]|jgi:hypothetical protein|uniref:translation initiation factor IF-1 n=1 Tax=Actibacterium sp. TaxID=1872125 RepID=UPI00257C7DCC|nr:translation initiation factor IF-1 [Actibacterium sp.]|tara:strand:+ start:10732 stop:10944 length:213 start_codon:yes stop_codon:yes gene_type:complete
MKIEEYERGYRDASRAAIAWLHDRAREMNDPKARDILNSAGFSYGQVLRDRKERLNAARDWRFPKNWPSD